MMTNLKRPSVPWRGQVPAALGNEATNVYLPIKTRGFLAFRKADKR